MSEGKKKPIVLILVVILLVVVGVGGYFAYTILLKKPAGQKTEIKYVEKELVEKTLPLDEFTVNLADEGGKCFIQTKLTIAYPEKNTALDEEIAKKLDKIKDVINLTLRQKKIADFDGNKLEAVKKELLNKINENLVEGRLTNMYITKIVFSR